MLFGQCPHGGVNKLKGASLTHFCQKKCRESHLSTSIGQIGQVASLSNSVPVIFFVFEGWKTIIECPVTSAGHPTPNCQPVLSLEEQSAGQADS